MEIRIMRTAKAPAFRINEAGNKIISNHTLATSGHRDATHTNRIISGMACDPQRHVLRLVTVTLILLKCRNCIVTSLLS